MTIGDEELMAYIDGEVSVEAARRVEAAMASDAALRRKVEAQRKLRDTLNAGFAPVLSEHMPERLTQAAREAPVSWRWRLQGLLSGPHGVSLPRLAALAAASLAIGIIAGRTFFAGEASLLSTQDGVTVASGALAQSLETRLAAETGSDIRIGVSFRDGAGESCRTFAAGTSAGVACRTPAAQWRIAALAEREKSGGDLQAAGAAMPDTIRETVTRMIRGEPFDAAAERRARDRSWK
jgi:hypothetical protein